MVKKRPKTCQRSSWTTPKVVKLQEQKMILSLMCLMQPWLQLTTMEICKFILFASCKIVNWVYHILSFTLNSMTSLLIHTVPHSTRPSFKPKTNNQLIKKFLSLAVSCVKVVKKCKFLTFKVNFLCQKLSESF